MLDGRYRFTKILGRGVSGMVVQARDERLARDVAVKLAPTSVISQRMLEEARTLAQLKRPECVVQVWETASGHLASSTYSATVNYIVMELVVGTTLREWQLQAPPRSLLLSVYANVAVGLHRVHSAGIVHGDVKPDNIIVDNRNVPTIVDFGFATSMHESGVGGWRADVVGTPPYMGPEAQQGEVGRSGDVHAYAVSLWEALTGQLPFEAGGVRWREARVGALPREALVPDALRKTLKRAMSAAPEQRPAIEEVHAVVAGAQEPSAARRSRLRPRWFAAGVALVALVSVVLGVTLSQEDASPSSELPRRVRRPPPEPRPMPPMFGRPPVANAESIAREATAAYLQVLDAWNSGLDKDAYHAGFEDPVECYFGRSAVPRSDVRRAMLDEQFDLGAEDVVRGPHRFTQIESWMYRVVSSTRVVIHEMGWTEVEPRVADGRVVAPSQRTTVDRHIELHRTDGRWRIRQEESVDATQRCWLDPDHLGP